MADVGLRQRALHGGFLLCLLIATTTILTSCRPQYRSSQPLVAGSANEVSALKLDVRLLQTLSNLSLSSGQIEDILPAVNRLHSLKAEYEQRKEAVAGQMTPLLAEKRAMLIRGKAPSAALDQRLDSLEAKVEEVRDELAAEQEVYVQRIQEILTPEQIDRLAGGNNARAQASELLTWLREMPSSSYAEEVPVHAEMLAAPELGLDAEVLREIFDTARNLSANEYASAQERLANRITPLYGAADEAETRAIVEFFSNRRMAAILREKAVAMAK